MLLSYYYPGIIALLSDFYLTVIILLPHHSARRFGLPTAPRDSLRTALRHTPLQGFLRPTHFKTYLRNATHQGLPSATQHRFFTISALWLLGCCHFSYRLACCNTGFTNLHSVLGLSRSFFACFTAPTTAQSLPRAKQHFNASLCNATHRGLPASATSS